MKELPFEILRLTSQFLSESELLQMQLVSKRWHEASSESLYSRLTVRDDRVALSYIRTISNCHKLGSYLKYIYVANLFDKCRNARIWDKNNLLNTLVKYCFNLRAIQAHNPHHLLWTRLIHAAYQGQLPNLQIVPTVSDDGDLESYVCTTLAFKKSLATLDLRDHVSPNFGESDQIINSRAFQELRGRIKEFLNLQSLSIYCFSNQLFSEIVKLFIDECPHLIELNVNVYNRDLQVSKSQNVLAIPKPNIRRLSCSWMIICDDEQLKYVMRSFPNLQYLYIQYCYGSSSVDWTEKSDGFSYDVMMEFMKYISNIKFLNIHINCKREDIVNYWSVFRELRKLEELEEICLYYGEGTDSSVVSMRYSENNLNLFYIVNNTDLFMPQEDFLREHGDIIKQLSVYYTYTAYKTLNKSSPLRYEFNNEDWICQILQWCPSLQELKLIDLVELKLPGNSRYQHTELKKLEIIDEDDITSLKFLRGLSFHVPNLKILDIYSFREMDDKHGYYVEIDMPYIMFNIITVKFNQLVSEIEDYFIKLNTIVEEKYYFITSDERYEINYNAYQELEKHCVFEIICRGLEIFQLIRNGDEFHNYEEVINIQMF